MLYFGTVQLRRQGANGDGGGVVRRRLGSSIGRRPARAVGKRLAAVVGLGALIASLLSGCGGDAEARLAKLRTAPLTDYELAQATETTRSEVAGSTGGLGSNETPSRIVLSYFVEMEALDQAFNDVVEAALAAGYVIEENRSVRAYAGSQDVNGQRVTVDIIRSTAENKIQVTFLSRS